MAMQNRKVLHVIIGQKGKGYGGPLRLYVSLTPRPLVFVHPLRMPRHILRMGVLARYLDLLPDAARTRVREASDWIATDHVDRSGARSLTGHAEDWTWASDDAIPSCGCPAVFRLREAAGDNLWTDEPIIGDRFRRLVERRGLRKAIDLVQHRLEFGKTARRRHLRVVRNS